MEVLGKIVVYIIMACCAAGGVASVIKADSGLGRAFHQGLDAMGSLFLPVVGLMASIPYLVLGVERLFGDAFRAVGSDPAIAAAVLVPADAGGYALFLALARSPEIVVIAMLVAIMTASTVVFNIPIGLAMVDRADHPYFALGAMSGFLAIPFGVLIACLIMMLTKPAIRSGLSTTGAADYILRLDLQTVLMALLPLIAFCLVLAVSLRLFPRGTIRAFVIFGRVVLGLLTLVAVGSIIEYYTGFFSDVLGSWGFDPIMADADSQFRALELLGTIGMLLSGAFPMVYLIRKFFGRALARAGRLAGLDDAGSAGMLAAMANAVAMFGMVKDMSPVSKVMCVAFTVCAGYCLGDWIAFIVNFQPTLVAPVFLGQLSGGFVGMLFARFLALPQLRRMEAAK